jgi:RimJ/RimL family protein N-acetyltransferase
MTKLEMFKIVQNQLAIDLNCTSNDLNGEKDRFIFVESKDNPGRRPFRRGKQFFEMLTMGKSIVVSATPARLKYAKEQLDGKERDDAFSMPFIRGHVMCYLPDIDNLKRISASPNFMYEIIQKDRITMLLETHGFNNALQYDLNHPVQNSMAIIARQGDRIAGIAGAFWWSQKMWSIGIDVLPEYRNNGLAAFLVNALTFEILQQNIVPVYSTASSNIASQKVGYRAGYMPAWMSDRQLRFEGELSNT